ncbi:MAG: Abi family protein [Candidatus Caenarcaniphilales bacterium]|nr:Abi family protein [Candidatus Caenarcaniphilales bacterium]
MKKPFDKPFKNYKEQIEILKQRGMIFNDDKLAESYLQQINYYRFSGYWLPFEENHSTHKLKEGTSFEQVLELYNFDRQLRLYILDAIERIEVSVRTNWSYQLSLFYGSHAHLNQNLAENITHWKTNVEDLKTEISRSQETFIKHFQNTYNEELPPIWVICEIMSLGQLSKWYGNLTLKEPHEIRKLIAQQYRVRHDIFYSWLANLRVVRNLSAHHCRLWDRRLKTTVKPSNTGILKDQIITKQSETFNRLYNSLVIMVYLMKVISPQSS